MYNPFSAVKTAMTLIVVRLQSLDRVKCVDVIRIVSSLNGGEGGKEREKGNSGGYLASNVGSISFWEPMS